MEYNIEKEYKMFLNKENFSLIVNDLDFDEVITQTNHYYSANDNMGMRIREKDEKFYFTLKHFVDNQVREYEFEIKELNINDAQIQTLLKELKIDDIKYLGNMKTIRYLKKYPKAELVLDESYYFNKVDYELEYELNNYLEDDFENLEEILKKYHLKYIKNTISKYQRFKEEMRKNI